MAIEAALTGHFVLSTLHTNDAPAALTRLNEMGVEPFLTGAAVTAVLAQRLARKLCTHCCEMYIPTREELLNARFSPEQVAAADGVSLYRKRGCPRCNQSGYKGRIGIYQLMVMNEELGALAARHATPRGARARGHGPRHEDLVGRRARPRCLGDDLARRARARFDLALRSALAGRRRWVREPEATIGGTRARAGRVRADPACLPRGTWGPGDHGARRRADLLRRPVRLLRALPPLAVAREEGDALRTRPGPRRGLRRGPGCAPPPGTGTGRGGHRQFAARRGSGEAPRRQEGDHPRRSSTSIRPTASSTRSSLRGTTSASQVPSARPGGSCAGYMGLRPRTAGSSRTASTRSARTIRPSVATASGPGRPRQSVTASGGASLQRRGFAT